MTKTKKIWMIVALALVSCLIVTTIILACVKSQFYDGVYGSTTTQAQNINVYRNGQQNSYDNSDKEFGRLIELYKESSKENVLLCIFEGAYSFDHSIETYTSQLTLNNSENVYLAFNYEHEQTLKFDGATYKNNDKEVKFSSLIVTVNNNSNYMKEVNVYVCSSAANGNTITPSYVIKTVAKQAKLLEYINGLEGLTA